MLCKKLPVLVTLMAAAFCAQSAMATGALESSITTATGMVSVFGDAGTQVSNEMAYMGTMPADGKVAAYTNLFKGYVGNQGKAGQRAIRFTPGVMEDIGTLSGSMNASVLTAKARNQVSHITTGDGTHALSDTLDVQLCWWTNNNSCSPAASGQSGWEVLSGGPSGSQYMVFTQDVSQTLAPGDYIIAVDASDWID